jgi:predicted dinucleotide-binding enzyme
MATAIIGTGNIGGTLARHLVRGGEPVVLAARDEANAATLAQGLGELARAASVEEAIAEADAVVFAVWLDTTKELIAKDAGLLENKVVVDPSNPLGFDENGQMIRTLPEGESAGSVVAALLPAGAHYVRHSARSPRTPSRARQIASRGRPCCSTPPTTRQVRRRSNV